MGKKTNNDLRRFIVTLLFAILLTLSGCSSSDSEDDTGDPENPGDDPVVGETAIIVDHNCTDLGSIPENYINLAKEQLRIGYGHTSHGSQLVTGLIALSRGPVINGRQIDTVSSPISFQYSGWGLEPGIFLNDYWGNAGDAEDLGYNGDTAWKDATISMLALPDNDRNVVIWSWCGGVSDNDTQGINRYLEAMNDLESRYPSVKFVYMTGHLDGSGSDGNLHQRNEEIRSYCRQYNKILFDFADIERYDPDGLDYLASGADDGCYYQNGNWSEEWMEANPDHPLSRRVSSCDECAHSHRLNCILKGQAFWWLLARLAGWSGSGS